jgi:hypothetical protein
MKEDKEMKFAPACKLFFGLQEGQGLKDFMAEIRGLTAEDRAEMAPLLSEALGRTVVVD